MTERVRQFARRADWPLVATTLLLVAIGLVAVWSFAPPSANLFWRQILWALIGLAACAVFASVDYRIFKNHGVFLLFLYAATVILLIALLLFAPATRGVRAWFQIGSAGVQPVELVKLVLVLVLAKYFSRRHIEIARIRHLVVSGIYVGVAALFVMMQPDLGSAIILGAIWLAMVTFSGIHGKHVAIFGALFIAASVIAWFTVLEPYQKARITSFINPYHDPRGGGYNTIQAMIAAGSGGVSGKGIGYGTQSHLSFLPEAETDFIFAAFAEEMGFAGALALLALFGIFFWRIAKIGMQAQDNFAKLFVLGFGSYLLAEMLVHMAINLGMLPVTGIVLPFISYGGSSIVTILAGVGILESIRIHSRSEIAHATLGG